MATTKKNILITGTSRGIGRELVDQLAANPSNNIIATARGAVDFNHDNVKVIALDQGSTPSVDAAASSVDSLDTIVINAAIGANDKLLDTSEEYLTQYLDINVTGVFRIVKAFLPALRAGKTRQIVIISSTSGSLAKQVNAKSGFRGPYAVTKAADNMFAVQLHNELHESEGFTVVSVHPGWVATDMGKLSGDGGIPPAESASGLVKVLEGLKYEDSCKFMDYRGEILPW